MVSFISHTVASFAEEMAKTGQSARLDSIQLLRSIKLFTHLPDKQLARVAEEASVYSYEAGTVICRQGEFDDSVHVILAGTVEMNMLTEKGVRIPLARLGPGALLGKLSATSDGQNMASALAIESTHVLALRPKMIHRLLEKDEQIARALQEAHLARTVAPALRQVPLFAEAGDAAIDALTRAGRLCVFAKGKVIFEKGEPGDSLYLVVSGVVKVYVKDRILAYLKNGAYFGEMALVKKEPRMASVAALTDVEAFQIMKADFEAFLRSHGPAADALRRTIQQREQENLDLERHPERLERLRFLENLMGAHDILVIDLTRCVRCDKCVLACARARGQALFERKGDRFGGYLIATACRQCRDPACMLCKRGAIVRDKTGEIYIKETCIGCGFCAKQCPFGNIIIVEVEEPATHAGGGAEPPRVRKKAAKCDLCRHLDYPPCAFNCPTGALARLEPEEIFLKPTGAGKR